MNDVQEGDPSPARSGYTMPAEWAPHAATWISWPHNPDTWPGCLEGAESAMAEAVASLATGESVHINVLDPHHEQDVSGRLERLGVERQALHFHHIPTNDAWCRDHGAIFVTRNSTEAPLAAVDFGFNAWGGKYPPWDLDDAVPAHMARILDVPRFVCDRILEGGSIEVNGAGALITTEQCLLHPNRNPDFSRDDLEQCLRAYLGVSQIIWLGEGIEGDDTDGHVDDITRFVGVDRVLSAMAAPGERNHEALAANRARLEATRLADGRPLRVMALPIPQVDDASGAALPASYANYYIGNRVILLPVFGLPSDHEAARIIGDCFADRRVCAIDCRDLVHGLGAFHCLTQQVPRV